MKTTKVPDNCPTINKLLSMQDNGTADLDILEWIVFHDEETVGPLLAEIRSLLSTQKI